MRLAIAPPTGAGQCAATAAMHAAAMAAAARTSGHTVRALAAPSQRRERGAIMAAAARRMPPPHAPPAHAACTCRPDVPPEAPRTCGGFNPLTRRLQTICGVPGLPLGFLPPRRKPLLNMPPSNMPPSPPPTSGGLVVSPPPAPLSPPSPGLGLLLPKRSPFAFSHNFCEMPSHIRYTQCRPMPQKSTANASVGSSRKKAVGLVRGVTSANMSVRKGVTTVTTRTTATRTAPRPAPGMAITSWPTPLHGSDLTHLYRSETSPPSRSAAAQRRHGSSIACHAGGGSVHMR
mmetsp:Transcript_5846/g.15243  ORF Transcript_5846/g.15243 Transcript_5846/m.15243 type:complete len:289 (+) Transcript_5846:430-1296(+)